MWRLENARMEISSMLDRLSRDGFPEMAEGKVSKFRRLQCFKVFETLKPCHLETLPFRLLADAEFRDDRLIALGIVFLQVVEQATPLADQHEKAAARAVVFLVRLEVLRQLANPFAEQRDLDFRTASIARMRAVLVDEGFLVLSG
jgi:hypothetical protein